MSALIIIGEYRSFDIMKYKIINTIKSNNCDVYMVFTNYKNQDIKIDDIPNVCNVKILSQADVNSHLSSLDNNRIMAFKESAKQKYNSEYKTGRSGAMFKSIIESSTVDNFFKSQYMQIYLYQQALSLITKPYKYFIKMRPDMMFNYQININELFDYSHDFYVKCMKMYKTRLDCSLLEQLLLFAIFKNNIVDAEIYYNKLRGSKTRNIVTALKMTPINDLIPLNRETFTYTDDPFDPIFMGFHYKSHSHNLITKLIYHLEQLAIKYKQDGIFTTACFNDLKNLTDKLVYMYHDYMFVSSFDTAKKHYVSNFNDYFNPNNLIDGPYFYCIEDIIYNKLFIDGVFPLYIYGVKQTVIRNIVK